MAYTSTQSVTYEVIDGEARRVYSAAEILDALRAILPSAESHVESLAYCWSELDDPDARRVVADWQAKLRRAYEVAGVEPPPYSVLRQGHTEDCSCQQPAPPRA